MRSSHRSCKPRQQANEPRIWNHFSHCFRPPPPPPQSYSTLPVKVCSKVKSSILHLVNTKLNFVMIFGQLTLHEVWNALFINWCVYQHAYIYVGDGKQQGFWRGLRRVAQGIPGATLASWVLSKLPKCFIARSTRIGAYNSQLFWYIFNPVFTVVEREIPSVRSYTHFRSYTRVIREHNNTVIWNTHAHLNLISSLYCLCCNLF